LSLMAMHGVTWRGKSSMGEISSEPDTHDGAENSLGEGRTGCQPGAIPFENRHFRSRPVRCWERLETLYSRLLSRLLLLEKAQGGSNETRLGAKSGRPAGRGYR
jgi:hypothetical protein